MKYYQELQEGLYDPNIFKAFFLAGGPGSGKNICSAPSLAGYRGSMIHVSNKPDACDLYFGARIDQRRLMQIERGSLREKMYTDTRSITKIKFWVPNGRGIVIDYANQSVYAQTDPSLSLNTPSVFLSIYTSHHHTRLD